MKDYGRWSEWNLKLTLKYFLPSGSDWDSVCGGNHVAATTEGEDGASSLSATSGSGQMGESLQRTGTRCYILCRWSCAGLVAWCFKQPVKSSWFCLCCLHCSVSSWMFVFCVTEDAARHNPDQPPGPHPRGLTPGLQLSCWWPRGTFIWPCLHSSPRACLRHHHRPPRHSPGRDSHEDAAQEPWLLYCKLIQRNEHTAHWTLVRLPLAVLFLLSLLTHHSVFCSRKATNGTLTSRRTKQN